MLIITLDGLWIDMVRGLEKLIPEQEDFDYKGWKIELFSKMVW